MHMMKYNPFHWCLPLPLLFLHEGLYTFIPLTAVSSEVYSSFLQTLLMNKLLSGAVFLRKDNEKLEIQ